MTEAHDGGTQTNSTNRITRYTYTGLGNVLTMTVDMPGTISDIVWNERTQ